ncbi:hypothetical protein Pint_23883 [Pistacia integerrima]|uniref:Uncharacterized protein n=1 Tax=Pistacia integerrima TaxID=434235 RepID=A0ACC0YPM2_9ROSI|nr:hypothetical protein Pint_23883 [Pistacia integerrima]
MNGSNNVY